MSYFNTKKPKEINAGSMADIAFLLLIFFLVATTISTDNGVPMKLSPYTETPKQYKSTGNGFVIKLKINANNEILLNGEQINVSDLKSNLLTTLSENNSTSRKSSINLQHDRATKYSTYLSCYSEIMSAYHYLWDQLAQNKFDESYMNLSKREQAYINKKIPILISELEPTKFGDEFPISK